MTQKRFWIVKDFDDKLIAIFTDEDDFRRFFEPECHNFCELVL